MSMRGVIRVAAGAALLILIAVACFFLWPAALEPVSASAAQPVGPALIARGQYLARAADCVACHTIAGGQSYAGGRAFKLPFGTIYSPNITPDPATGIGSWSDAEFVRAIRRGVGRHGEDLYPALPYTAYARLTTDDALAIRAYLATLPAVQARPPANTVSFPFDQRFLLRAWKLVFLPSEQFTPDRAAEGADTRGAYLVDVLGHCGECHTPRNAMFGLDQARKFGGETQLGWLAYNLSSDRTNGLGGWSDASLEEYLSAGHADGHGPASGPMAEVVANSLRFLDQADIRAMVHYLRSVPPQNSGPAAAQPGSPAVAADPLGARLFVQACAGCHLPNGQGRQSPWAALRGSHSAADPAGTNLVQVLTQGTEMRTNAGMVFMHPFTSAYSAQELAALANYVAAQFGNHSGSITFAQIRQQQAGEKPAP